MPALNSCKMFEFITPFVLREQRSPPLTFCSHSVLKEAQTRLEDGRFFDDCKFISSSNECCNYGVGCTKPENNYFSEIFS